MLQKPLDKSNVITVLLVYLCGVPLAKAVGADAFIAQIVTDKGKLLLYGARCQGKHQLIAAYSVAQTEIFNILIDNKGNSENTLFPCFLFCDSQAVAAPIIDDIREMKPHNVANPDTKITLQNKCRCDTLIRTETSAPFSHRRDDFSILFRCRLFMAEAYEGSRKL